MGFATYPSGTIEARPTILSASSDSEIYTTDGTKALTAPTGASVLQVQAITGTVYVKLGSSGSLPATWPPAADDTDAEAWYQLVAGSVDAIREFACVAADTFRLEIPSGAVGQVFWY